jgi:3-oxoacyl-[acyl-carrier protein] reductase
MELRNKKIIVTGGAGGIGKALVQKLLYSGAAVAAVDNNQAKITQLRTEYLGSSSSLEVYQTDVSDKEAVSRMVEDFFLKHGEVDALVNNAAILVDGLLVKIAPGRIEKYPLSEWERTFGANLFGSFYVAREVVAKMVSKRTKGVVVNISSISSAGNVGQSSYAASKAAMNALTVTWAQELAMYGIRVAGLAPGMTNTDMPSAMSESILRQWIQRTPLKRMAQPEEIADGIMFILKNDFFCGRTLELDGGLRM